MQASPSKLPNDFVAQYFLAHFKRCLGYKPEMLFTKSKDLGELTQPPQDHTSLERFKAQHSQLIPRDIKQLIDDRKPVAEILAAFAQKHKENQASLEQFKAQRFQLIPEDIKRLIDAQRPDAEILAALAQKYQSEPFYQLANLINEHYVGAQKQKHIAIANVLSLLYLKLNINYLVNFVIESEAIKEIPLYSNPDDYGKGRALRAPDYSFSKGELSLRKFGFLTNNLAFHLLGYSNAGATTLADQLVAAKEQLAEEFAEFEVAIEGILDGDQEKIGLFVDKVRDDPTGCIAARLTPAKEMAAQITLGGREEISLKEAAKDFHELLQQLIEADSKEDIPQFFPLLDEFIAKLCRQKVLRIEKIDLIPANYFKIAGMLFEYMRNNFGYAEDLDAHPIFHLDPNTGLRNYQAELCKRSLIPLLTTYKDKTLTLDQANIRGEYSQYIELLLNLLIEFSQTSNLNLAQCYFLIPLLIDGIRMHYAEKSQPQPYFYRLNSQHQAPNWELALEEFIHSFAALSYTKFTAADGFNLSLAFNDEAAAEKFRNYLILLVAHHNQICSRENRESEKLVLDPLLDSCYKYTRTTYPPSPPTFNFLIHQLAEAEITRLRARPARSLSQPMSLALGLRNARLRSNPEVMAVTIPEVFEVIRAEMAFLRVDSTLISYGHKHNGFAQVLKQLADPVNFRPIKQIHDIKKYPGSKYYRYDLRAKKFEPRSNTRRFEGVNQLASQKRPDYPYTKKLSYTWLPPLGKTSMYLGGSQTYAGLLIDIRKTKGGSEEQTYTFTSNAFTVSAWWLSTKLDPVADQYTKLHTSFAEVKKHVNGIIACNKIPPHTEFLLKASKDSVLAVFCIINPLYSTPRDQLTRLLVALLAQALVRVNLKLLVPILKIETGIAIANDAKSTKESFAEYTKAEQLCELELFVQPNLDPSVTEIFEQLWQACNKLFPGEFKTNPQSLEEKKLAIKRFIEITARDFSQLNSLPHSGTALADDDSEIYPDPSTAAPSMPKRILDHKILLQQILAPQISEQAILNQLTEFDAHHQSQQDLQKNFLLVLDEALKTERINLTLALLERFHPLLKTKPELNRIRNQALDLCDHKLRTPAEFMPTIRKLIAYLPPKLGPNSVPAAAAAERDWAARLILRHQQYDWITSWSDIYGWLSFFKAEPQLFAHIAKPLLEYAVAKKWLTEAIFFSNLLPSLTHDLAELLLEYAVAKKWLTVANFIPNLLPTLATANQNLIDFLTEFCDKKFDYSYLKIEFERLSICAANNTPGSMALWTAIAQKINLQPLEIIKIIVSCKCSSVIIETKMLQSAIERFGLRQLELPEILSIFNLFIWPRYHHHELIMSLARENPQFNILDLLKGLGDKASYIIAPFYLTELKSLLLRHPDLSEIEINANLLKVMARDRVLANFFEFLNQNQEKLSPILDQVWKLLPNISDKPDEVILYKLSGEQLIKYLRPHSIDSIVQTLSRLNSPQNISAQNLSTLFDAMFSDKDWLGTSDIEYIYFKLLERLTPAIRNIAQKHFTKHLGAKFCTSFFASRLSSYDLSSLFADVHMADYIAGLRDHALFNRVVLGGSATRQWLTRIGFFIDLNDQNSQDSFKYLLVMLKYGRDPLDAKYVLSLCDTPEKLAFAIQNISPELRITFLDCFPSLDQVKAIIKHTTLSLQELQALIPPRMIGGCFELASDRVKEQIVDAMLEGEIPSKEVLDSQANAVAVLAILERKNIQLSKSKSLEFRMLLEQKAQELKVDLEIEPIQLAPDSVIKLIQKHRDPDDRKVLLDMLERAKLKPEFAEQAILQEKLMQIFEAANSKKLLQELIYFSSNTYARLLNTPGSKAPYFQKFETSILNFLPSDASYYLAPPAAKQIYAWELALVAHKMRTKPGWLRRQLGKLFPSLIHSRSWNELNRLTTRLLQNFTPETSRSATGNTATRADAAPTFKAPLEQRAGTTTSSSATLLTAARQQQPAPVPTALGTARTVTTSKLNPNSK